MNIANKLEQIYNGVEDVREALQEFDENLGRGTVDTLGDDVRIASAGKGYGVKVYGDVRSEEEVEVEDPDTHEISTETQYTYTKTLLLNRNLNASEEELSTSIIDGLGELGGDMVTLANGNVEIPLATSTTLTVNPAKVYVYFKDPIVENIVLTNWGTDGKITLAEVREITSLGTNFIGSDIESFNELKWFDGLNYNPSTGAGGDDELFPFKNCKKLVDITLPRVHSLGNGPFYGCESLAKITIPDSFTDLGKGNTYGKPYFYNTQIEELIIPSSVTHTCYNCFNGMPNLKKIVWGENLAFPRNYTLNDTYPYLNIKNCPNLETIENIVFNNQYGVNLVCGGTNKLDYSTILPRVETMSIITGKFSTGQRPFEDSNIFDYAQNGIVTFANLPQNESGSELDYLFNSSSEAGFIMRFPNWTKGVSLCRAGNVGRVELNTNVESVTYRFWNNSSITEFILPTTTPPASTVPPEGSDYEAMNDTVRVFVPEQSMSSYLADEYWNRHAAHLRPIVDTSNVEFCSIPDISPVPTDYSKVEYIKNYTGETPVNCQISDIGYQMKQHTQLLLDFSHEWYQDVSEYDTKECLFNAGGLNTDFYVTISSSDRNPSIYRKTSHSNDYPNRMGLDLNQRWYFNSNVTGEKFGQRSTLKMSDKCIQYHGLIHPVDEMSGDSNANIAFLSNKNSQGISGRKLKIYRMCMFEPTAGCNDYDDPTQYEIVRDYIPVMRNSDNVFGLYERITDTFYPSTVTAAQFSGPIYE